MGFYGILMGFNGIYDGYPLVNIQKTMKNHMFARETSTISTGPFSSSQTVKPMETLFGT